MSDERSSDDLREARRLLERAESILVSLQWDKSALPTQIDRFLTRTSYVEPKEPKEPNQ